MPRSVYVFIFVCLKTCAAIAQVFTLRGTVSDSAFGEAAIGALVYVTGTSKGINTNAYGYYALALPKGDYQITCAWLGYHSKTISIRLDTNLHHDFFLSSGTLLEEVVVSAEKDNIIEQVTSTQMSAITLPVDQIKNLPTLGGETDIIKVMQLLPGVQRGDEGQNGMFVRGGNLDGNLILLDEAVVYNASHLFGFFSVFNNDALNDITLYKGGFPAQYGGRLSSVIDIRMKEGDQNNFRANGGIGLLSSNLTLQGPIIKNKMSFLVSGRRSYIDQVFRHFSRDYTLPYFFHDFNAKLNYTISKRDRIYLSGYYGDDVFEGEQRGRRGTSRGSFRLGNLTTTLRWNHVYGPRLFSNVSLIHTRFRYDVEAVVPGNSFFTKSRIADLGAKADYNFYYNNRNTLRFGAFYTQHQFRSNVINTAGEISEFIRSREGQLINTAEFGWYAGNDWDAAPRLKINYGLRHSMLVTQNTFYQAPEPRLSGTFNFAKNQSIKAGYSRMVQYLHLVSSSAIALPTDLWYPVTRNVKPLTADQLAMSYNLGLHKINSIFTAEVYYKHMTNVIDYREGAVLLLNDDFEADLVSGRGYAYGGEFLFSKTKGRLTGWVGYTLSWSLRQFKELNQGRPFFARYDRRHDVSVVGAYDITRRIAISCVWVFATGQRFTPLTGNYFLPNSASTGLFILPVYSNKNAYQMPSAHRLDMSLILRSRLKRKWVPWVGEWHLGAYNVYNRAQPQRVEIVSDGNGGYKYQAVGLFGFIPFVAYNFKV